MKVYSYDKAKVIRDRDIRGKNFDIISSKNLDLIV